MLQRKILVVGSLNMDQIVHIPRIPVVGETLLVAGSLKLIPGGKGANQAVAIARLGAPVAMAGRVGNDSFGQQLLNSLRSDNVDTSLIVVDPEEASGVGFVFLTPDGNNAIVVAPGANRQVGQDMVQIKQIFEGITESRALVLQLEIPLETVITLVETGHKCNIPVILNLAPAQPIAKETLKKVAVLIVNETEASLLSGQRIDNLEDAQIAATLLLEQGIPSVVITLGSQGALLALDDSKGKTSMTYQPAPRVQVVDSTAAGDCFVAALTVALIEGQPPEDALKFSVYASALKVTKFGAQSGLPTREEVNNFQHSA